MSTGRYVPPKIRKCGDELRTHNDPASTLSELKEAYPTLTSFHTAINRLRSYLIATEERHPQYEPTINSLEQKLLADYQASVDKGAADETIKSCLRFLYDFKGVPLKRQVQVLHKLKRRQMSVPDKRFEQEMQTLPLLPEYVTKLHLSSQEHNNITQYMANSQQTRSANVVEIANIKKILRMCNSILRNDESPFDHVCVAIALLTGRRTIEILQSGRLTPVLGQTYFGEFSGQVKTGLQQIQTVTEDLQRSYVIPVLTSVRVLSSKLQRVQAECNTEGLTRETMNHKYSQRLSKAVKELVHPNLRFHDLRTLYALISFEAFKPHTYGVNGWVCRVLGHSSINMSTHYTRMQIGPVPHLGDLVADF